MCIRDRMYNPIGGSEYEFIELTNLGDSPLNLNGVSFKEGIQFVFDDTILLSNESVVLVSNLQAFTSRYGTETGLIKEYQGKLNNAGEKLVMQLPDPFPFTILNFNYDDKWYPAADGEGYSIVYNNTSGGNSFYNDESWSLGSYLGSPNGYVIYESYEEWSTNYNLGSPYQDQDEDGVVNGLEYLIGGNPKTIDDIVLPQYDKESNLIFWEVSKRLVANDFAIKFQSSSDLTNWNNLEVLESQVGPLIEEIKVIQSANSKRLFFRLKLEKLLP